MRLRSELQVVTICVVFLAVFVALRTNARQVSLGAQTVHLSSVGERPVTVLVTGAGMGMRLLRLTPGGTDVGARLDSGPLRVIALGFRPIQLYARGVRYGAQADRVAHLIGRGHLVSLRADAASAGVRTF